MHRHAYLVASCVSALILSASLASAQSSDSRVIRVSKNSSANLEGFHYSSIQGAIDSVSDASATTPTVILIYPGTYQESVLLNKSNVSLVGIGSEAVAVSASSETSPTLSIALESGKTRFGNAVRGLSLDIVSNAQPAIKISGTNSSGSVGDVSLANIDVSSGSTSAIEIENSIGVSVNGASLSGVAPVITGTVASSSQAAEISYTTLFGTAGSSGDSLVDLSANYEFSSTAIESNTSQLTIYAIEAAAGKTVTLTDGLLGANITDLFTGTGTVEIGSTSALNSGIAWGSPTYLEETGGGSGSVPDPLTVADLTVTSSVTFTGSDFESRGTGADSFVAGRNAVASHTDTVSIGTSANAWGLNGVAVGANTEVGPSSVAIGKGAGSEEERFVAIGTNANADANYSVAIGYGTDVTNRWSTAVGYDASASAQLSTAIGAFSVSSHQDSVAIHSSTTASDQVKIGDSDDQTVLDGSFLASKDIEGGQALKLSDHPSTVTATTGSSQFFSSNGEMWVVDSAGNFTQLSTHADPRRADSTARTSFADPNVELPWSLHHKNVFVGTAQIVDVAKALHYIESKMISELGEDEGRIFFSYDLPEEEKMDYVEFAAQHTADAFGDGVWTEVSLKNGKLPEEAWESVEILEQIEEPKSVRESRINWATKSVEQVTVLKTEKATRGTGKFETRLKDGYKFEDGKLFKLSVPDRKAIRSADVPVLPEWVTSRIEQNSKK